MNNFMKKENKIILICRQCNGGPPVLRRGELEKRKCGFLGSCRSRTYTVCLRRVENGRGASATSWRKWRVTLVVSQRLGSSSASSTEGTARTTSKSLRQYRPPQVQRAPRNVRPASAWARALQVRALLLLQQRRRSPECIELHGLPRREKVDGRRSRDEGGRRRPRRRRRPCCGSASCRRSAAGRRWASRSGTSTRRRCASRCRRRSATGRRWASRSGTS